MTRHSRTLMVLVTLLLIVKTGHTVMLNGVDVPKEKLILYIFIGHSNMQGYGGVPDTVAHPRVWAYSTQKGFWNARDPVESSYYSPSPFMPFLKKMAGYYPDYYFCGIKVTMPGTPMHDNFLPGKPSYIQTTEMADALKDATTLGGILAMFGYVEGISDTLSASFDQDLKAILAGFRQDLKAPDLPMIIGRYEENGDTTAYPFYNKYRTRIKAKLEGMQAADSIKHRVMLTPFQPVPKTMYFDSHHYSAEGYTLWSETAAEILHKSNWNFWCPQKTAPFTMLFPRGGERFSCSERIPITWLCDPDSLSVGFLQCIQDSGKTMNLISGDRAFAPSIKTFYWTPATCALNFTNSSSTAVEYVDYDSKHLFDSPLFYIDPPTAIARKPGAALAPTSFRARVNHGFVFVTMAPSSVERTLGVYSLQGRCVMKSPVKRGAVICEFPSSKIGTGIYLITLPAPLQPERLQTVSVAIGTR
jgi:hypothetical protein